MNRDEALRVLGLQPGCSDADVSAAYRRKALLHHPDRHTGTGESAAQKSVAARQWLAVQSAYDTLTSKGGGAGAGGGHRARQSEWQRATQHSGGGARWREDYSGGWEETDMRGQRANNTAGAAGETAGAAVRRRLSQSLAGAAVGGLVLAFLAVRPSCAARRRCRGD